MHSPFDNLQNKLSELRDRYPDEDFSTTDRFVEGYQIVSEVAEQQLRDRQATEWEKRFGDCNLNSGGEANGST